MKNRLYLFILIILSISFSKCSKIAAGSYPYAERYELDFPESKVIKAIENVKTKNPGLQVAKDLIDTDSTDFWHHEWFSVGDRMIMAWTRPLEKNKTTFALVGVGTLGSWRHVNNDLSSSEDDYLKRQFEKLILNKVKIELQNRDCH